MKEIAALGSNLAPINGHRTLEEQTYQRLRAAITGGTLEPGAKLVGSQMAMALGVSRITVANALKRLASEGFVVVTPHKEAMVAALDRGAIHEMATIRYALEDIVLHAAALRVTPDEIAALRGLDSELHARAARSDLARYRAGERAFHLAIYDAAHLPLTATLLTDLWDRFEPYRVRRYVRTGVSNANHIEHAGIIAALAAGDGDAAAAAMRAHVQGGYDRTIEALWPAEA